MVLIGSAIMGSSCDHPVNLARGIFKSLDFFSLVMLGKKLPIEMSIFERLTLHIHEFENYSSLFKGTQLASSPSCQHIIECFLFYLVLGKLY